LNKIDAQAKSVSELLSNKKYAIDYYQREYKWETKQIIVLLEDLEAKFLDNYEEDHPYIQVQHYRHYFLGPIIISNHDDKKFIIDGQQRLTSLSLLLIFLQNLQKTLHPDRRVNLVPLIYSDFFGEKTFNLAVDERKDCFRALLDDKPFEPNGHSESVHNIVLRCDDIKSEFPESLRGNALIHFIFWLQNNVDLIEITTYSDDEA
jgi:Protein of unknown function DUF262